MDVAKFAAVAFQPGPANTTSASSRNAEVLSSAQPEKGAPPSEGSSREQLQSTVSDILSRVQMVQRNLNFSVDDSTGQIVVKVIDSESGQLVRQIPSEELLELAERFDDMRSLMRDTKV